MTSSLILIFFIVLIHEWSNLICLQAVDNEGLGQSTVVPLKITLVDSNDNSPVFSSDTLNAVIDEGATKFEPPLQVQVCNLLTVLVFMISLNAYSLRSTC